jgi:hypothetical protein
MLREREKDGTGSVGGRSMVTDKVCFPGVVQVIVDSRGQEGRVSGVFTACFMIWRLDM